MAYWTSGSTQWPILTFYAWSPRKGGTCAFVVVLSDRSFFVLTPSSPVAVRRVPRAMGYEGQPREMELLRRFRMRGSRLLRPREEPPTGCRLDSADGPPVRMAAATVLRRRFLTTRLGPACLIFPLKGGADPRT